MWELSLKLLKLFQYVGCLNVLPIHLEHCSVLQFVRQGRKKKETPTHSKHYPRLASQAWYFSLKKWAPLQYRIKSVWALVLPKYIHVYLGGSFRDISQACQLHKTSPKWLISQFIIARAYECLLHVKLDTTRRFMDWGKAKLLGHQSFELNKFEVCNVLTCYKSEWTQRK